MADKLQDFYAAAEELGLLLCFHLGVHWHRIKDYHPLLCDELAYFYPKLKFTMEHVGGLSFFFDALAVLTNNLEKRQHLRGNHQCIEQGQESVVVSRPRAHGALGFPHRQRADDLRPGFPYNGAAEVQGGH